MSSEDIYFKITGNVLHLSETKVYWENKILNSQVENPTKIRYGIAPIQVDLFTIGTNFKIQLENDTNSNLNISIKSYFGLGRAKKYQLYEQIADEIWYRFFELQFEDVIRRWEDGQEVKVGKYLIDNQGITKTQISGKVVLNFDEMSLFQRFDHLLINSNLEPNRYFKLVYLDDWNWPLVYKILKIKLGDSVLQ